MMTASERDRLLHTGCGADEAYPSELTVLDLFARTAAASPAHPAVIAGSSRLTYAEVDRRVSDLARHLVAAGVSPGGRVAICLARGSDQIIAVLGVLLAGCAFVPIDPAQPRARVTWMLADAAVASIITDEEGARHIWGGGPATVGIVLRVGADRPDWHMTSPPLPGTVDPGQPAYVIYTSGSTGRPKGVVISHRNLVHSTEARRTEYRRPVGTYLLASTLAFDSAMAGLFWTLCCGGTLVLPEDGEAGDPEALRRLIAQHAVTHLLCLPSLYGWVLDDGASLSSMQVVIVAGEACPRALAERHHRVLPGVELHNEYGPTECAVWTTVHETRPFDGRDRVPVGRPIARARVYVAQHPWELSPAGTPGEALIGGEGVSDGYLGRPDLTADRFVPDAWSGRPGARAYRTGDRVSWLEDGALDFLGRLDTQIKLRGYRIELEEVEAVLAAHSDVRECVVLVRDDGQALDACVVLRPGVEDAMEAAAAVRAFATERLPAYMVPADVVGVTELPKMTNGKVDRAAAARLERHREEREADGAERPATPAETTIATLWAELLGRDGVSRQDNFFDLGGHSLLAIEVFHRLRETLAPELRLVDLFEYPTVQALATFISGAGPAAAVASTPVADAAAARSRLQSLGGRRRAARAS